MLDKAIGILCGEVKAAMSIAEQEGKHYIVEDLYDVYKALEYLYYYIRLEMKNNTKEFSWIKTQENEI